MTCTCFNYFVIYWLKKIGSISFKNDSKLIYHHIAKGVRLRNKCDWYEQGKKSTKFFLNLEKQQGTQNKIRKLILTEKEIMKLKF